MAKSPFTELCENPNFVDSLQRKLWEEEVRSGGGVSYHLDATPHLRKSVDYLYPEHKSERAARWALSVPGDLRNGTLYRILSQPGGASVAAMLFIKEYWAQQSRLLKEGVPEEDIPRAMAQLAPAFGDERSYAKMHEALVPILKEHNALYAQVTAREEVVERLAQEDDRRAERAEREAEAADRDLARRDPEAYAKVLAQRAAQAERDARREADSKSRRSLEEKVRAAYDKVEEDIAGFDPKEQGRETLRKMLRDGDLTPEQAAAFNRNLEDRYAFNKKPVRTYDDQLHAAARQAYQRADDKARLEAGELPESRQYVARDIVLDQYGDARVVKPGGTDAQDERRRKTMHDRAREAYEKEAGKDRLAQQVVSRAIAAAPEGSPLRAAAARSAEPKPPKGLDVEAHVERAYRKAEEAARDHEAAASAYREQVLDIADEQADARREDQKR